ncbi:MAG: hypothetical protein Q9222_003965 [Ikaeria aurantiellina]
MSVRSQKAGRMPQPSVVSTSSFRPPSLDVSIAQDCAFPPFPTNKSRSATPTTPSDPTKNFTSDVAGSERQPTLEALKNQPGPQRSGNSILQRMNSIAPGPFNINEAASQRPSGHQRTVTASSTKDFVRSSSSSNGSDHSRQPSVSSATRLRNPSLSSIAGGPKSTVHRDVASQQTMPTLPSLANDLSRSPERVQVDHPKDGDETLKHGARSHTFPLGSQQGLQTAAERPRAKRRPSEPAVVAAMKPLHEIGSTSSFNPTRSVKGRKATTKADDQIETEGSGAVVRQPPMHSTKLEDAPPMPKPTRAREIGNIAPYHTPTESNSSNESSGSDSRSVSSRSTPPLSASPQRGKRRPSGAGQIDNLLQGFRFGTEQVPVIEEPVPPRRAAPPSFSRPMYSRSTEPSQASKELASIAPESPIDPAIQHGRPFPTHTASDFNAPPIVPLQHGNLRLSPPPPSMPVSPVRKPTASKNKGNCRGCGELIKGKSVSSADGRLTGRYHRSCFVCKTCKEPFQTADFYVLDNHPFCSRHYHVLNGSLCKTCDRGIEGQYLETELKQKFHPYCFTCQVSELLPTLLCQRPQYTDLSRHDQDCHKILRDDYFEMNGMTYCEQHALGVAQQQTSLLGPGRRHPERRTTRLMMMT